MLVPWQERKFPWSCGPHGCAFARPELKQFLKNDEDRLCMMDVYDILSYKLRRHEPTPKTEKGALAMKGDRIGRDAPIFGY